jgi:hypothetical protein
LLTRAGKADLADPTLLVQENDTVTLAVAGDAMDALEQHVAAATAEKGHH